MSPRAPIAVLPQRDHDKPFISLVGPTGVDRLNWGEFWSLADGYARLIDQDSSAGDLLLIMSRTRIEAIAFFFAAMAAGRIPSFFPPPHRIQNERSYRSQQSASISRVGASSMVTFDQDTADSVATLDIDTPLQRFGRVAPGDAEAILRRLRIQLTKHRGTLFVQHSSGTTGVKKAVGVDQSILMAQYDSYWNGTIRAVVDAPRIASWLPLYHDMGLIATLVMPTLGGDEIAFVDPFAWVESPQLLFDVIEREKSNLVWMPNFAYRHYVRLARALKARDLSSVAMWINCSEACRAPDIASFEQTFEGMGVLRESVVGCYAMAEAVFAVSQGDVGHRRVLNTVIDQPIGGLVQQGSKAVLSSGRLIPGAEVAIMWQGQTLPDGHYGEIAVRGPFVFGGYEKLTPAESNIGQDGYFLTGDLGAMVDGEVFVCGRLKEMIICNGKNIFCGDVEAIVGAVPGLKAGRVVAFGVENATTGSEDLVIVAELTGTKDREAEIVSDIRRAVDAAFLVTPKAIKLVDERWLAKTTSGKISRKENRDKFLGMNAS